MLQTAQRGKKTSAKKVAPHERFLEAFRWMLLARTLEEKLVSLYRGGQITGGVYIGKGQEAVSVACGMFLQKGDVFGPLIRDQAGRSAFGEPLLDVVRTYLGSVEGPMRGSVLFPHGDTARALDKRLETVFEQTTDLVRKHLQRVRISELLRKKSVAFTEIDVSGNRELRAKMTTRANGRTTNLVTLREINGELKIVGIKEQRVPD